MASRAVVPHQPRVGGGKQKNEQAAAAAAAQGRNRRALGDIGNLAPVPAPAQVGKKPQTQISRPITRSFCAQLLANAQAAAEKNKKPVSEVAIVNNNNKAGKGATKVQVAAAAAAKKKEIEKPKVQPLVTAVIISPVDNEDDQVVKPKVELEKPIVVSAGKSRVSGSTRKPVVNKTLTSILTARSKAACGLANKPKDVITNIDASDADNELAVVEYVEDLYNFYKLTEGDTIVHDYMDSQAEVNHKMRSILVDWLIEVHRKFELMPESLYLTVNIIDRYLSMKSVSRRQLQLVGISSMLIACKYEEIWAPEVNEFIAISDNAYVREQVLMMEKSILGKLEWYLTVPTPYVFLVRYIKASHPSDQEMENMVFFLAELGVMHYSTSIMYCPSMLAASAVYAARCTLNNSPPWNQTLKHHTGYSEDQLTDCAKLLVCFHSDCGESKLKAVQRKFSSPERGGVALFPPAKSLSPAASSRAL